MRWTREEESSVRAYLLGELAPEEQRKIEERLLFDEDFVELLLIIEEELIDSYERGTLSDREGKEFESYFLTTPERKRKLRMARVLRAFVNNPRPIPAAAAASEAPTRVSPRVSWRQPLLAPAWRFIVAAALVLGGIGAWRIIFFSQSFAEKGRVALKAAFHKSPIEARITSFNWAPQPITRGGESEEVSEALESAENYLKRAVVEQPGPDSHHALGQFYLATKKFDRAVDQFKQALEAEPENAKAHSDLGAALLEKAKGVRQNETAGRSLEEFAQSLEHLDKALTLNDSLLEALFDRALCREYMQMPSQAEADWHAYLERDAKSVWADEARRHLEAIENRKRKISQTKEEILQDFLSAYRAGDDGSAWKLVSCNREVITGRPIWWQLLGDSFELTAAGLGAQADERLLALQYVGKLESYNGKPGGQPGGDPYILELARFYQSSSLPQRAALGQAHALVSEGNNLFLGSRYDHALSLYIRAGQAYAQCGDHWEARLAEFLSGYCYFQTAQLERSLSALEQLARGCEAENYLWLLSQTLNALGSVQDALGELSKGAESTERALEISERIADAYGIQKNLAQLSDHCRKVGDFEQSLTYVGMCLARIGEVWPGARQMWRSYNNLAQILNAKELVAAATGYEKEALRLALEKGSESDDPAIAYVSYVHLGVAYARQRYYAEAIEQAQLGFEAAQTISDEKARMRSLAYASVQLGHLHRQAGDCRQALYHYDRSIAFLAPNADSLPALAYDAHKGSLFCHVAQGNDAAARAELQTALQLLDRYRINIREEKNRNAFFNVEQNVYDAAIDFAYSRAGNTQEAFEYSEASRARSLLDLIGADAGVSLKDGVAQPFKLEEIQRRLPDQTQVLQYAALDDKLIMWVISKDKLLASQVRIPLGELTDQVLEFRRSVLRERAETAEEAKELYRLLIEPVEVWLEKDKEVCVVPDKALNHLPFNALVSPASGRYLIRDYQLSFSPSTTVYIICSEEARSRSGNSERLLVVGNPRFDRSAFPSLPDLPSAAEEAQQVAAYYRPLSLQLTGSEAREEVVKSEMETADVIHLASHYVVDEWSPMHSKLLLAEEPDKSRRLNSSPGVLQAREIYGLNLRRTRLVVLSACQSGLERYYNGEGMIGMSRVFIAAGVPQVIGSLWPVDSLVTTEMMVKFHRYRKREGLATGAALRRAQLDLLSSPKRSDQHPYYWAPFITIGGHASSS